MAGHANGVTDCTCIRGFFVSLFIIVVGGKGGKFGLQASLTLICSIR